MAKKKATPSPFEKYKPEPRCKLCQLLSTHKSLWITTHEQVLKEGMSYESVAQWLNAKLEILNLKVSEEERYLPFSKANFSTHFNKHVPSDLMMGRAIAVGVKGEAARSVPSVDPVVVAEADAHLRGIADEQAVEHQLQEMLLFVKELVAGYRKELARSDGSYSLSKVKVSEVRKLSETAFALQRDFLKYRKESGAMKKAIESAIELSGSGFAHVLNDCLNEYAVSQMTEESLNALKDDLTARMAATAREVYGRVLYEYKLV